MSVYMLVWGRGVVGIRVLFHVPRELIDGDLSGHPEVSKR